MVAFVSNNGNVYFGAEFTKKSRSPELEDGEVNGVCGRNFPSVQDRCGSKAGCCPFEIMPV